MAIEQLLRKEVEYSLGITTWEENPLITIGLSHAILTLKVTDQQLFKIVRGYLRQLAASVHPDVVPESTDSTEQRSIMNAFEVLDNEENFRKALVEFRELKNDERQEVKILRSGLDIAKSRVLEYDNKILELSKECRILSQERIRLEREKQEWEIIKTRIKAEEELVLNKTVYQSNIVANLRARIASNEATNNSIKDKLRNQLALASYNRRSLFFELKNTKENIQTKFFTFLTDQSNYRNIKNISTIYALEFGRLHKYKKEQEVPVPEYLQTSYNEFIEKLKKLDDKTSFVMRNLTIKENSFSERIRKNEYIDKLVIGSIPFEKIFNFFKKGGVISYPYVRMILENIDPYIVPENVLVTTQNKKFHVHYIILGVEYINNLLVKKKEEPGPLVELADTSVSRADALA